MLVAAAFGLLDGLRGERTEHVPQGDATATPARQPARGTAPASAADRRPAAPTPVAPAAGATPFLPGPRLVPGPTFVVNALPVGCHATPHADAPIIAERWPGTVQAMDLVSEQADGTWHREVDDVCWTRTDPGPIACVTETLAEAEECAAPFLPVLEPEPEPEPAPPELSPAPEPAPASAPAAPSPAPARRAPAPVPAPAPALARSLATPQPQPANPPPAAPPAPAPPPTAGGPWTVIVHSLAVNEGAARQDAEQRASELRARGHDTDILLSSDYESLRPGFWVVHSGRFGTQAEAQAHAGRLQRAGYPGTYPRLLQPRSTPAPQPPPPAAPPVPAPNRVWTVIVHSLPVASGATRRDAERRLPELHARGHQAAVLHSTDYPSLRPGYWAVSSGRFRTQAEAQAHATRLQAQGYAGAYPRWLERGD